MPPQWAAINSWKFLYKKERIGYIRLIEGNWFFDYIIPKKEQGRELYKTNLTIDENFEEFAASENLQEFIWDNVKYCTRCISAGHCSPKNLTILGKEYKRLCWNGNLSFKNPDAEDITLLKKLYNYLRSRVLQKHNTRHKKRDGCFFIYSQFANN